MKIPHPKSAHVSLQLLFFGHYLSRSVASRERKMQFCHEIGSRARRFMAILIRSLASLRRLRGARTRQRVDDISPHLRRDIGLEDGASRGTKRDRAE
jgi:uncharacterized protein YjiS (DUF1127 family)